MVALSAVYLDDIGRVRLTASAMTPNVRYRLQHSLDNVVWADVRGGGNMSTTGVSIVDDYEYAPNVINYYRLIEPAFYDSFNRTTPSGTTWVTADTGQSYTAFDVDPGAYAHVTNGVGVIGDATPLSDIIEMTAPTNAAAVDAEVTYSAIQEDANLDVATEYNVGIRGTDASNYYEAQLLFENVAGGRQVQIRIAKFVAGTYTQLALLAQVGQWSAGVPWYVRFRVIGSSLMLRIWELGTNEPNDWQLFTTDTSHTTGTGLHIRGRKNGGAAYEQQFGPIEVQAIPNLVGATASVTPSQAEVWLKSVAYPLFNTELECTDWDAIARDSRVGLYDVKGRHQILAITDVGSSGTFSLTFVSRSEAQNAAILGLITYGGVLFLQPPGDSEDGCEDDYAGIPYGYVVPSGSTQPHSMRGQALWVWEVEFTQVAQMDTEGIIPTTITWIMLWAILGSGGTWTDLWALWDTWEELWLTQGNPEDFS